MASSELVVVMKTEENLILYILWVYKMNKLKVPVILLTGL